MVYQATRLPLNTGAMIPAIGFGTWHGTSQDTDAQEEAVLTALEAGYIHIDTASIYGTEPAVARAIKRSGIPREKLFITTKLWNNSHDPEDVEKAINTSLKNLETFYIDLYFMHWPSPFRSGNTLVSQDSDSKIETEDADYVTIYKVLEATLKSGKTKAIGVFNFSLAELEQLLSSTSVVSAAHQIELHLWLQQNSFAAFHKEKDIHIQQYAPLGNQNELYVLGKNMGKLIEDPVLVEIGKKHGKSGAQVALAWGVSQGHSVLPKSKTPSRIKENLEGDFKLDEVDLEKLKAVDKKLRFNDPSERYGWNFFADLDGKR